MVLASRASGCLFWTPKPIKRTPQDTQNCVEFLKVSSHLLIIPITLCNDIMPYFDEFIHVYGWNMSILWPPLKMWTPQNFTTAYFRHPVSKFWLRHCLVPTSIESLRTGFLNYFESLSIGFLHQADQGQAPSNLVINHKQWLQTSRDKVLFHLNIISMTLYIKENMPYFNKYIHVCGCGCNLGVLWFPMKNRTSKNITFANFGHKVS